MQTQYLLLCSFFLGSQLTEAILIWNLIVKNALLTEAKKLENSEIVLGRSLKGYDSTFTYSHIHRKKNTGVHTELILTNTRDWSVFGR